MSHLPLPTSKEQEQEQEQEREQEQEEEQEREQNHEQKVLVLVLLLLLLFSCPSISFPTNRASPPKQFNLGAMIWSRLGTARSRCATRVAQQGLHHCQTLGR